MAVKKNKTKEKKVILIVGILLLLLLLLGVVRVVLINKKVSFDSRVKSMEKFQKDNKDISVAAWLQVQGTNIDYPVLTDMDTVTYEQDSKIQYLWENGNLEQLNKINYIMGHNVMNLSRNPLITEKGHVRFEQLLSFSYLDFAKKNQYIQLTLDGKDYVFKIFSVAYPKSADVYSYNIKDVSTEKVKEYIDQYKKLSVYNYDVDVNENDIIISLVTCTRMYSYSNNMFVVSGRLVREGENTNLYKVTKSKGYAEIEKQMKGEKSNEEV